MSAGRGPFPRGGNGGGGTAPAAGALIQPDEGFAFGASFYVNPTGAPIALPDPLDVAAIQAAGFVLQGAVVLEVDENGATTNTSGVLRIVNPTDGSPSYLEFTDSEGTIASV